MRALEVVYNNRFVMRFFDVNELTKESLLMNNFPRVSGILHKFCLCCYLRIVRDHHVKFPDLGLYLLLSSLPEFLCSMRLTHKIMTTIPNREAQKLYADMFFFCLIIWLVF